MQILIDILTLASENKRLKAIEERSKVDEVNESMKDHYENESKMLLLQREGIEIALDHALQYQNDMIKK